MFIITHDVVVIKNAAAPTLSGEAFNRGGGIGPEREHNKSPTESRPWRLMPAADTPDDTESK